MLASAWPRLCMSECVKGKFGPVGVLTHAQGVERWCEIHGEELYLPLRGKPTSHDGDDLNLCEDELVCPLVCTSHLWMEQVESSFRLCVDVFSADHKDIHLVGTSFMGWGPPVDLMCSVNDPEVHSYMIVLHHPLKHYYSLQPCHVVGKPYCKFTHRFINMT